MPKHTCLPLKICSTIPELENTLKPYRADKRKIGFVPTMGALHEGHLSLITIAKAENDVVVCSIFVNPTQFNDPNDLEKYPRPLDEDERILTRAECDVLFIPSVQEMYPNGDYSTIKEDFGILDKVMEGKSRPGHFAGMITIVNRLFQIIKPDNAYFGKKDFQQLTIVKYFVRKHNIHLDVKACPIVREPNGLAMSSRNRLLSEEEKIHAVLISQTLFRVKEMWGKKSITELKNFVYYEFEKDSFLTLDYFEIVYADTLIPVEEPINKTLPVVACIAAFAGSIRLIDNESL